MLLNFETKDVMELIDCIKVCVDVLERKEEDVDEIANTNISREKFVASNAFNSSEIQNLERHHPLFMKFVSVVCHCLTRSSLVEL